MQLDRREEDGGSGGEQRAAMMTGWKEGDGTDRRDGRWTEQLEESEVGNCLDL